MTDSREGGKFELLLRLVDVHGNIIRPGVFLPAAEWHALAAKLDRRAVGTALDWLGRDSMLMTRTHATEIDAIKKCFSIIVLKLLVIHDVNASDCDQSSDDREISSEEKMQQWYERFKDCEQR